jgi:hypothetical protein
MHQLRRAGASRRLFRIRDTPEFHLSPNSYDGFGRLYTSTLLMDGASRAIGSRWDPGSGPGQAAAAARRSSSQITVPV